MGQGLSCAGGHERSDLLSAVKSGDLETLKKLLEADPSLLKCTTLYRRHSLLHIAAASGQIDVLSWILDRSVAPDVFNRHKQTPLMLAAMHGKISCVQKLISSGANILMFDSRNGRTCLHYAAYYGHSDCLQTILTTAQSSHVAASWGFTRFVNIRDTKGATPLHLAARKQQPDCVDMLLDNGALVCASTGSYCYPWSTPLHLAARGGSLDCIRKLLAWGADRLHRDAAGRIPYMIALKNNHGACAALLNPSSAEPLVWPSPLKFISELNPEAKLLLERVLMDANREREKDILKDTANSIASPSYSESGSNDAMPETSDTELCCICFDQVSTIEVRDCGHRMCAHCTLSLCCHNKPNPITAILNAPVCPFCRSNIAGLAVAKTSDDKDVNDLDLSSLKLRKSRRSWNLSEGGSSSFKGLSGVGSFSKTSARGSGRILGGDEMIDKLDS